MEIWDNILNECTKPLDFVKNRMKIIELLIKYEMMNEKECKMKLMLDNETINKLKQKILQRRHKKEELMQRMRENAQSEASLINTMFGYDDDDDTESDSNQSIIYDID